MLPDWSFHMWSHHLPPQHRLQAALTSLISRRQGCQGFQPLCGHQPGTIQSSKIRTEDRQNCKFQRRRHESRNQNAYLPRRLALDFSLAKWYFAYVTFFEHNPKQYFIKPQAVKRPKWLPSEKENVRLTLPRAAGSVDSLFCIDGRLPSLLKTSETCCALNQHSQQRLECARHENSRCHPRNLAVNVFCFAFF